MNGIINCNSGFLLSKDKIAAAIQNAPAVADVLKKLAGKVARGVRLPASFTARGLDYAAQRELEHLFGTLGRRNSDGALQMTVPQHLCEPCAWSEAMAYFEIEKQDADESAEDVFARLRLMLPDMDWFVDALSKSDEINRYLSRADNQGDWLTLAKYVLKNYFQDHRSYTTLSQLGSDIFNDSKKLRSGALRNQLRAIFSAVLYGSKMDERELFEGMGIFENPYTSNVTLCAPIAFVAGGQTFDFPLVHYESNMACQLPLATILEITEMKWFGKRMDIVTSENASPFMDLVSEGTPCVYTEGYPNAAVKMFLRRLSKFKLKCIHAGDADLDGFLIAEQIRDCIRLEDVKAYKALYWARRLKLDVGIPLTNEQRRRIVAYVAKEGANFRVRDYAEQLLGWGRWIEQESFASIFAAKTERRGR